MEQALKTPSLSGYARQEGKFRVAIGAPRGDIPGQGDSSMSTQTAVLKKDITPQGSDYEIVRRAIEKISLDLSLIHI